MSTIPVEVGRRRFLMGAAGLAAAPLVAGMAGCAAGARPAQPGPTAASGAGAGANPVSAATTVTGRRRIGSLEVSNVGLGCKTMNEELGTGFVAWGPWGYGCTTGTITPFTRFVEGDFRGAVPHNTPENLAANMPLDELQELNTSLAGITIHGDRLPAPVVALSGVEARAL
jgi:hypothetical protein